MKIKKLKVFTSMVGLSVVLLAGCKSKNFVVNSAISEIKSEEIGLSMFNSKLEQLNVKLEQVTLELEKERETNELLAQEQERLQNKLKVYENLDDQVHFMYQDTAGIFRFSYLKEQRSDGHLVFDKIGSEFQVVSSGESKLLVDALDNSKIYLRDFEELGHPFYFKGYDPNYGGCDQPDHYCGWVLPVYYSDSTFSLYDFDDFHLLLANCDVDEDYANYGDILGNNPLTCFYLEAYDPLYGGHDQQNNGSGLVCQISKNDVNFLVDANDFMTFLDEGFINSVYSYVDCDDDVAYAVFCYGYRNDVLFASAEDYAFYVEKAERAACDIVPYYSDFLVKNKSKK